MNESQVARPEAPLIDVILPAFNGSKVIRKALESALAQDVPLRIIVVDDGSSDDSAAIAREYGSGVDVIVQQNRGVSGARNTGLRAARAAYVAFLDQDDAWKPGKLARQLELLERHPEAGLVFTDMIILEPDGTVIENGFLHATPLYSSLSRLSVGRDAFLLPDTLGEAVVRFNFISPSTALVRRTAILEIGGFDEAFRLCDDADCWMRLLHRWRGIAIQKPLVLSYRWGGNASRVKWRNLIEERLRIGEKAALKPELFPAGTAAYFERERPRSYYRLGIGTLRSGDARSARSFFLTSLRDRWKPATVVALIATLLPARVRDPLWRAKSAASLRRPVRDR